MSGIKYKPIIDMNLPWLLLDKDFEELLAQAYSPMNHEIRISIEVDSNKNKRELDV